MTYLRKQTLARVSCGATICLGLVLLAGCVDANRAQLVGNWQIENAESVSDRINAPANAQFGQGAKMTLDFYSNGTFKSSTKMGPINREKSGTWVWVSYDETKRIADIQCEIDREKTNLQVEFIEDKIRLVPPNMAGTRTKIVFARAQ